MKTNLGRVYLSVLALLFAGPVLAQSPKYADTPEEKAMCEKRVFSRKSSDVAKNDKYRQLWLHMHHYCFGLRDYERALKHRGGKSFNFHLKSSLQNFDYVLRNSDPTFYMIPEVMVMRGRSLELAKRDAEAVEMYMSALKRNPRFALAYAALGNYYRGKGDKQQALRVYTQGLRYSPKNKYLRARYQDIGGDPESLEAPLAETPGNDQESLTSSPVESPPAEPEQSSDSGESNESIESPE
jgi:tetratricopeptide (TPR) repeat protein